MIKLTKIVDLTTSLILNKNIFKNNAIITSFIMKLWKVLKNIKYYKVFIFPLNSPVSEYTKQYVG